MGETESVAQDRDGTRVAPSCPPMTKKRVVDNSKRPAQPEPDEDPALHTPPVREQGTRPTPVTNKKRGR